MPPERQMPPVGDPGVSTDKSLGTALADPRSVCRGAGGGGIMGRDQDLGCDYSP